MEEMKDGSVGMSEMFKKETFRAAINSACIHGVFGVLGFLVSVAGLTYEAFGRGHVDLSAAMICVIGALYFGVTAMYGLATWARLRNIRQWGREDLLEAEQRFRADIKRTDDEYERTRDARKKNESGR